MENKTIDEVVKAMETKLAKSKFEYGAILNAKKYYDRLLRYFMGRYEQMKEVMVYFETEKR